MKECYPFNVTKDITTNRKTMMKGASMKTSEILNILQKDIHRVIIATVDEKGHPVTCAIDLMLYEDDTLYFLTARGKSFYQRLMSHPFVSLTGIKGNDTLS